MSAEFWESHLPGILVAFWCRDSCDHAQRVHAKFLETYNQTDEQTPLLRYDTSTGFSSFT